MTKKLGLERNNRIVIRLGAKIKNKNCCFELLFSSNFHLNLLHEVAMHSL